MSFPLWWMLSFAAPAGLALITPSIRSLAVYTLVSAAAVTAALRWYEQGITEATDGAGSPVVALLFWTSYGGLIAGAIIRLTVLTFTAPSNARRARTQVWQPTLR